MLEAEGDGRLLAGGHDGVVGVDVRGGHPGGEQHHPSGHGDQGRESMKSVHEAGGRRIVRSGSRSSSDRGGYRRTMVDLPRIGLVLGAGGVAGGAFHAGVLAGLEEATGWDPRSATVIVGTSAGSITGTSLRAGLGAADLLARAEDRPLSAAGQRLLGPVGAPVPPSLRPTRSTRPPAELAATLARAVRRPFAARPWALAAALLPEGSVSTALISDGIGALSLDAWPSATLWICAVRQADGRRVVFGRGEPRPPVHEAVAASCAIPGFFRPVVVGGEAYIDGGVHSPTNADVLRDVEALDLVIVASPMSRQGRRPRLAADQAMRGWSGALLDTEAAGLRRRGVPVLGFQPDEAVLAEMGLNAMDPSRRAAIAGAARAVGGASPPPGRRRGPDRPPAPVAELRSVRRGPRPVPTGSRRRAGRWWARARARRPPRPTPRQRRSRRPPPGRAHGRTGPRARSGRRRR